MIAMDPSVVAALLRYTGPVHLATLDQEVGADNAAAFLLLDQYVLGADDNDARADALAEAASLTFDALLAGALPEPITLARDLGPLASRAALAGVERRRRRAGAARSGPPRRRDPRRSTAPTGGRSR